MTFLPSEKKYSYFLIAVIGSVIILSVPLIFGQVFYSENLLHVAIHEIGFVLAAFTTFQISIFIFSQIGLISFTRPMFTAL